MIIKRLPLEEIIEKTEQDGVLWDIDRRDYPIMSYKFLFEDEIAIRILEELVETTISTPGHRLKFAKMMVGNKEVYFVFDYSLSAYIVRQNSDEAKRIRNKKIEIPSNSQSLLIVNVLDTDRYKDPVLDFMNVFYSTYRKFRTP